MKEPLSLAGGAEEVYLLARPIVGKIGPTYDPA
jgi:hypothetical protein